MATAPEKSSVDALNEALRKVAQQGLSRAGFDAVEAVARAVWHSDSLPDFAAVQGSFEDQAVWLLQRLSFYNIVAQPRKKASLAQTRQALGPSRRTLTWPLSRHTKRSCHGFSPCKQGTVPAGDPLDRSPRMCSERQAKAQACKIRALKQIALM